MKNHLNSASVIHSSSLHIQFENNPPLIEDSIKVTTILKEELNTKNFDINLKNKTGTKNTIWLSSKEIQEANNIEDLVKERFPKN